MAEETRRGEREQDIDDDVERNSDNIIVGLTGGRQIK